MITFKPQKGKAFDKLPQKTLVTFADTKYVVSKKYDGNQIFIVKENNKVYWFTSDWKQFDIPGLGLDITHNTPDFVLMAEFMYDCDGKLGSRKKSAILTSLRTAFNKGLSNPSNFQESLCNIQVFDCIMIKEELSYSHLNNIVKYTDRVSSAHLLHLPSPIQVVNTSIHTGYEAQGIAKRLVNEGWEGVMLVEPDSYYNIGKRVNYSIKLKYRKTADLLCVDVEEGLGKYTGVIGSLVLKDSEGRIVRVGSGLSDIDRTRHQLKFIGKVIEIEYEQIMDTYIQPTYLRVREDKTAEEID